MSSETLPLEQAGYRVIDDYLTAEQCQNLLNAIENFRAENNLPEIHRPMKGRPLRYHVIQGELIREELPEIWNLYTEDINQLVNESLGFPLEPLENVKAGVNVNLMLPRQSSYRWHYDRACVTSILYLNEVEGGETELYPNYRIMLGKGKASVLQRLLDSIIHVKPIMNLFGKMIRVSPKAGRLVMMRADRAWHSVRPVMGEQERISVILSYDLPGTPFPMEEGLDSYLYTQDEQSSTDPNYG